MILDGNYPHTLALASEIKRDFTGQVEIIAAGSSPNDLVLRSRYCDRPVLISAPDSPDYAAEIVEIIKTNGPDVVIPVGYRSVAVLAAARDELRSHTRALLPSIKSTEVALGKISTLSLAAELGIPVPMDFTARVRSAHENHKNSELDSLPYPLFLKIAHEIGGNLTGVARNPSELMNTYTSMASEGHGDDILVQEFIDTEPFTYGCALLYSNGRAVLEFQHVETRSVPRLGGSATRAHIEFCKEISESSRKLLDALDWEGPALVEFKKDRTGRMVLMEINPKFWASYALASRSGYRFGSDIVQIATGLNPRTMRSPQSTGRMVFPFRELRYALKHRANESILRSIGAMLIPPTQWDMRLNEVHYFLRNYIPRLRRRIVPTSNGDDNIA